MPASVYFAIYFMLPARSVPVMVDTRLYTAERGAVRSPR